MLQHLFQHVSFIFSSSSPSPQIKHNQGVPEQPQPSSSHESVPVDGGHRLLVFAAQSGISGISAVLPAAQRAAGRVLASLWPSPMCSSPLFLGQALHSTQHEPGNGIRGAALPHPCSVSPGHVSEPFLENGARRTHHCQLFHQAAGPLLSEDPNKLKQSTICPQSVCQAWLGEEGRVWNSFLPLSQVICH